MRLLALLDLVVVMSLAGAFLVPPLKSGLSFSRIGPHQISPHHIVPSTQRSPQQPLLEPLHMAIKAPRTPGYVSDEDAIRIGAAGIAANIVCSYSLYVLRTTSCGLPPGFLGLLGALEGISYTVVVGIFGWSLLTYAQRKGGLDAGPFGLLGLAEGLTYLTVVAGVLIALLNLLQYGFLPGFLPNDRCFGISI